jgi:anthranilate synthase component 1
LTGSQEAVFAPVNRPAADRLPALKRARPRRYPFLLESTASGGGARYSILFAFPGETLALSREFNLSGPSADPLRRDGDRVKESHAFLSALDRWWRAERHGPAPTAGDDIPFRGGWFVYLGYELAAEIEQLPVPPADSEWPIAFATRIRAGIVYDHEVGQFHPVAEAGHDDLLDELRADLARCPRMPRPGGGKVIGLAEDPPARYLEGAARAREYVHAGDVFQVNLARAWRGALAGGLQPADIYARLREANPAPFAGFADYGRGTIVSSSPERLVRVAGKRVETRPIAGTRPRHADCKRDRALLEQLKAHPKERAEHVMLIDLERNDLGRIARIGSVCVDEMMASESYAHVHHIVSNVSAELQSGVTPGEVVRAVFPGGTITGCPKVRSMEIIAELEGARRGPYTGAMGYLNRDGDMDLNILIRTLLCEDDRISFHAGAGIVADSVPEFELKETRAKARGLLAALGS